MLIAVLAGFASGIISGMGIGGGTILIPVLVFVLHIDQHIAQSINLLYFIPTAIIALIVHIKNKRIDFKLAMTIVVFGILGAVLGSHFAVSLPSGLLKKMFGIFLFSMGIYETFRKPPAVKKAE
ncbi:sulfite exporter TauE/SafE family protein [Petroclostridium sp. X23]|uniref:sulfite exporter TauE/SafE family protein n=1 Tax=Petroclostridium sp. X23 TaxID=3045146 RepID=UPI0024AE152E|nr:sulfite exporter TauE/SafE family protein [Petroclostridium sp. X23]WHH59683.1 sulfite exporter TauE/SafE family protein [Petroclostridium sp. X23]